MITIKNSSFCKRLVSIVASTTAWLCLLFLSPASAMDTLTQNELSGIEGRAGLTVSLGSTATMEISFSRISYSDPDGDGWVIMVPPSGYVDLSFDFIQGTEMELDVASTPASTHLSDYKSSGLTIPKATSFFELSMPAIETDLSFPPFVNIGVGNSADSIDRTFTRFYQSGLSLSISRNMSYVFWAKP